MLFNATHAEETRLAIVDGQKLIDIDIETTGHEQRKSNIYMGVITRIEPSLEACFVNYGEERHGFLPFKEISRKYFKPGVDVRTATIRDAVEEGQEILVQVEKEERGNKGAALTTFVNLAGRYLVLMSNNSRGGGVSRRIEGEERQELREAMSQLTYPAGMSLIGRTAGIGRTVEELQWDLNYLVKLSEAIEEAATPKFEEPYERANGKKGIRYVTYDKDESGKALKRANPAPYLILEESNLVIRAIRDYFNPEIGEILVDTEEIYEQARQFMSHVMPDMIGCVKRYQEDIPLFSRFQIEHQIETAYSRTVQLPSGGAIVIDHTEALVAIDVNSAHATRGTDIEETAFKTNCEAADEVARQMRLRDLGGLIVIDFIDMLEAKNQHALESRLKEALRYDRARVQMAKVSRFGLIELSRQRLRPALAEGSHITCPRCNGVGVIRDTESCALQILRIIEEEAFKESTGAVHAQVPVDVATFLLNEKRRDIAKIEARHHLPVVLIPNKYLETPHYRIERIRTDDERLELERASYKMAEEITPEVSDDPYSVRKPAAQPVKRQTPVIRNFMHETPAPEHIESERVLPSRKKEAAAKPETSLWQKFISLFTSSEKPKVETTTKSRGDRRSRRPERGNRKNRVQEAKTTNDAMKKVTPSTPEVSAEDKPRQNRRQRPAARPARPERVKPQTALEVKPEDQTPEVKPEITEVVLEAPTAQALSEVKTLDDFDSTITKPKAKRPARRAPTKSRTEAEAEEMGRAPAIETTSQVSAIEVDSAEPPAYSNDDIRAMTESVAEGEEAFKAAKLTRKATPKKVEPIVQVIEEEIITHSVAIETKAPLNPLSEAVFAAVSQPVAQAPAMEIKSEPASVVTDTEPVQVEPQVEVEVTKPETVTGEEALTRLTKGLDEALAREGLEVVATDPSQVKAVDYSPVKYPGRKRKVLPEIVEEPLIQVQTKTTETEN